MAKAFLGKSVKKQESPPPKMPAHRLWLVYSCVAVTTFAASLFMLDHYQQSSQPLLASVETAAPIKSQQRTLGSALQLAANSSPSPSPSSASSPSGTVTTVGKCEKSDVPDPAQVFPFIPSQLREGNCAPPQWNMYVFQYFINKLLIFANWLAGALAVILTVYAGVLYIAGVAKEDNAKKAKTMVVTAYVGFIIVLLARLIVGSWIQLGSGSTTEDFGLPDSTTNYIQADPSHITTPKPTK